VFLGISQQREFKNTTTTFFGGKKTRPNLFIKKLRKIKSFLLLLSLNSCLFWLFSCMKRVQKRYKNTSQGKKIQKISIKGR
jgi:hypothetical protein